MHTKVNVLMKVNATEFQIPQRNENNLNGPSKRVKRGPLFIIVDKIMELRRGSIMQKHLY